MKSCTDFRAFVFLMAFLFPLSVEGFVRRYNFTVVSTKTIKLCSTKTIVTVNGKFPGPTLYAREDDNVIVRVTNNVNDNITIHWHGVRQQQTGWADGPAYVTQCPIQPGWSFVYNFTVKGQRGTLLWHAHISWLRATVHGAIVILPNPHLPYPFPKPHKEKIIILGEWWKSDVEAVVKQATQSGFPPNISDSHTINGFPGISLPNCPSQEGYTMDVKSGKTYLLRIVNAALNDELFFTIAGHNLTVVEADASYTKPFETDTIFLSPGQTTNALLEANRPLGSYLIAVSPFMDAPIGYDNTSSFAVLRYEKTLQNHNKTLTLAQTQTLTLTLIPPQNDTPRTKAFLGSLRSLNSGQYPARVPLTVDHRLLFTISIGVNPCDTCSSGSRLVADINNVSFVMPSVALLQAHYYKLRGVFKDNFPGSPPFAFNYTGDSPAVIQTNNGTRLYRLSYNSSVQVVLQGTSVIAPENHPTHLHGFNFYVVGEGLGNFDPEEDPKIFNLVDPVERNTVGVPTAGWVAIRFRADNPGVWFLHCHLEVHTTWGLKMAFLVDNGFGPNQSLPPPPIDLPQC